MLDKSCIRQNIGPKAECFELHLFEEADSTNNIIKSLAEAGAAQGAVAIAQRQYAGRGRKGRSFISPDGGLYLSLLLRPKTTPETASLITCAAAVAVCETVEQLSGSKAQIKWVNDVLINGKKVCGILTESKIDAGSSTLDYAVLGIGINIFEPKGGFDKQIKDIACAVFENERENLLEAAAGILLEKLSPLLEYTGQAQYLERYIARSCVIGREVNVISADSEKPAKAVAIDEECRLIVEYKDGSRAALSSEEVSIRPVGL